MKCFDQSHIALKGQSWNWDSPLPTPDLCALGESQDHGGRSGPEGSLHTWGGPGEHREALGPSSVLVCQGHHYRAPQTRQLKQQNVLFSQFWRLPVQVWFPLRPPFLACRHLSSPRVPTWSSLFVSGS